MAAEQSLPAVFSSDPVFKTSSRNEEKVSILLKWHHQFQFAGIYAAQKQGFFGEEGLKVEIHERDITKNNIRQVLSGEFDYGISDSMLLLYKLNGEPVHILAAILQHSPQVLVTLQSSSIDSPFKLQNRKMAFYEQNADGFPILAMLETTGVKPNIQRIVSESDPDMLLDGRTEAFPCYLTNEPYYLREKGAKLNIINPIHYGIDLYGDMLFTNTKEMEQHPERAKRFKRAVIKGWGYALKHKEEMIQYIKQTYHVHHSLKHLRYEADIIEELISPNSIPIGTINSGRISYINYLFSEYAQFMKNPNPVFSSPEQLFEQKETVSWHSFLKFFIPLIFIAILIYFYQYRLREKHNVPPSLLPNKPEIPELLSRQLCKSNLLNLFNQHIRAEKQLGLIMIELDDLPQISTTYGEGMADEILTKACHACRAHLVDGGSIGYWENHTFLMIFPETELKLLTDIAHKMQKSINNIEFSIQHQQTASMGLISMSSEKNVEEFAEKARLALLAAKSRGDNNIKTYVE